MYNKKTYIASESEALDDDDYKQVSTPQQVKCLA